MSLLQTRPNETCYGTTGGFNMCFKKSALHTGGSRHLMSELKFIMLSFFSPISFHKIAVPVYACYSICYTKGDIKRYFSVQPSANNSVSRQLLLRLTTFTVLDTITRKTVTCYNPHRTARLILLQHPATPRSGFALRV